MRIIHAAAAVLAMSIFLIAAPTTAETYRNPEYGISAPVPDGLPTCHGNHGVVIFLETTDATDCNDYERRRLIEVFAFYNALDATKTLKGFLKWECAKVAKGQCRPAQDGLRITGMQSAAARVNRSDGWIDVLVVTQAGAPDRTSDHSAPSVNYALTLHTTPDHLKEDLRSFRTLLRAIRLSPPK